MKEINDIGFYIKKLSNHIEKLSHSLYSRKETQECSLSNLWIINYLAENEGRDIYQKDIEAEFSINRATASKMLSLMEEKKFISRTASVEDGRLKKINLLFEGKKLKNICFFIKKELEKDLASALTDEERETLRRILKKMLNNCE